MSATEVLRRLLDERGVEWGDDGYQTTCTVWAFDGIVWHGLWRDDCIELIAHLTPEQAIAATLGDADATGERQRDAVEVVRCMDCKHGHITVNGKSCKWCDLIATHDPDGCEPYNGYDPEPYFDADFFCAWGERRESE